MQISSDNGRVVWAAGGNTSTMAPAEALERAYRLARAAGQDLASRGQHSVDLERLLLPGGRIHADEALVYALELFAAGGRAALEQRLSGLTVSLGTERASEPDLRIRFAE